MKGERNVREEAQKIKEALKKKDGLVEADKQDKLREQIENAFSDENLDNLSAEIETGTELDRQSTGKSINR